MTAKKSLVALLAVVILSGLAACSKPKIVLEDMHAGVWMATDNTSFRFYQQDPEGNGIMPAEVCGDQAKMWGTCEPDAYDTAYRHGVVFQMGYTVRFPAGATDPAGRSVDKNFGGIYIKHTGGEEWLIPGARGSVEFDWLDVRAAKTRTPGETGPPAFPCVIDPHGAYMMLVNPNLVDNGCADPLTLSDPAYHCARNRSLHTDVESHWLVTYWSGAKNYEVNPGPTDEKDIVKPSGDPIEPTHDTGDGLVHVSYTFKLNNPVVVDRWLRGCHEETYTGVTEIRILHHRSITFDQGYPHLPVNGGRQ